MEESEALALRFERQRFRLLRLAYRLLGSTGDAEDAVQEAWLRLQVQRGPIDNLDGWLTTTVGRISLNVLRTRRRRLETALEVRGPELVVEAVGDDPAEQAVLADSVGVALLVVLDALTPQERVSFVLHDVFGVPFGEVAELLVTTPAAARKLASRARRRVQDAPVPDQDVRAQQRVVDAFFAAAREGRLVDLAAVLHPDVVLRVNGAEVAAGPSTVARRAAFFASEPERQVRPVLVNGVAGVVIEVHDEPVSVMAFTVVADRIAAIDTVSDPARLARLTLP